MIVPPGLPVSAPAAPSVGSYTLRVDGVPLGVTVSEAEGAIRSRFMTPLEFCARIIMPRPDRGYSTSQVFFSFRHEVEATAVFQNVQTNPLVLGGVATLVHQPTYRADRPYPPPEAADAGGMPQQQQHPIMLHHHQQHQQQQQPMYGGFGGGGGGGGGTGGTHSLRGDNVPALAGLETLFEQQVRARLCSDFVFFG